MKYRLLYLPFLLLPLFLQSCGDDIGSLQKNSFIKLYGSYLNDAGKDVKSLPGGGYAVTGSIVPDSISRMVLIRTDEAGNQVPGSPSYYGGPYLTGGNSLLVLDDGFLLGGFLQDTALNGELQTDMYIVRTDADGEEMWSQRYGNNENDELFHVIRRATGGFVLGGKKTTNEDEDVWILMVDENGETLYDFTGSAFDDDDEANFLLRTPDGYLCGCTYDEGAYDGTDFFIASLDENCNIVDSKTMGTDDDDFVRTLLRFNDQYLLMGYTENGATGLREVSLYTFSMDQQLIKDAQKLATISSQGIDLRGEDCVINSKGEIVIFGSWEVNDNRDMWLIRLDEAGNVIEDDNNPVIFGKLGSQQGWAMDRTYDGGLILTGNNTLEGNSLITLIKTDAEGGL